MPGKALEALEKLMMAGEAPQKILGGVTFTFRKLAEATERARAGTPLRDAISGSGIFPTPLGRVKPICDESVSNAPAEFCSC